MLVSPPTARGRVPVALPVPDTAPAPDLIAIADSILAHRFPLLGLTIDTGPTIDWRRDYLHGISSGAEYFRRVPYLDFARVGDHKVVWELNRHQHLVLLAQAFHSTGRREYLDEAFAQLSSWLDANPFLRGINWASALEVAFRALSWAWLWTLAGPQMPPELARRFIDELYRHGRFLELNLSVYFSPNTHLLGEAVALYALGVMFSEPEWKAAGARWTEDAMARQVREDGSHFEQSAYYHVYALDFFLLYRALGQPDADYNEKLLRMAEYLDALMGPSGILPLIGDDDGGRLFHPYGDRTRFGQATLAGFKLAPRVSRLFKDAGTAVMTHGDIHIVIKAGGFGEGSGGHSHSDILSLVARIGDREILIDPGAYTYIADPAERNAFRGSTAHNTVRMAGRDQAIPAGPFRWLEKPDVRINAWSSSPERDFLDATCEYGGFTSPPSSALREKRRRAVCAGCRRSPGLGTILAPRPRRRRGTLFIQRQAGKDRHLALPSPLHQGTRNRPEDRRPSHRHRSQPDPTIRRRRSDRRPHRLARPRVDACVNVRQDSSCAGLQPGFRHTNKKYSLTGLIPKTYVAFHPAYTAANLPAGLTIKSGVIVEEDLYAWRASSRLRALSQRSRLWCSWYSVLKPAQ